MSKVAIAIDIGGSHIECGIVSGDQVVTSETIQVKNASFYAVLPSLEKLIHAHVAKLNAEGSAIAGIAVGICAVVDRSGSIATTNGKYDDGLGFNFSRWSETSFGLPCVAENDTRLALLGEHHAGAAKGSDDAVLVTLGTGIGGAALLGGKLLRSEGGRAGGLAGHLGVDWRGRMCTCGNRGCAEAEASTASLNAICREWQGFAQSVLSQSAAPVDFRRLFEAVDRADPVAQQVLDHCLGVWSALTVSLIHAYDPRLVLFGGGVLRRHDVILPRIREHVARHAWLGRNTVTLLPAALGSHAALLGAIPLLAARK